jgi:polyferredoxin
MYGLTADLVLLGHAFFVSFIVLSLPLIWLGAGRHWMWVRNQWFRGVHLGAIIIVAGQAWAGVICPLTTLESFLRSRAGEDVYTGSFIRHWLHRLLFYQAEPWVFSIVYTIFSLAVLVTWWLVRPDGRHT